MVKYNNHGDITLKQPIGKQDFNRPYKKIATFNGCFYLKKKKIDWLLDLEDLFDYMNTSNERKVTLALYKLSGYALSWWEYI